MLHSLRRIRNRQTIILQQLLKKRDRLKDRVEEVVQENETLRVKLRKSEAPGEEGGKHFGFFR